MSTSPREQAAKRAAARQAQLANLRPRIADANAKAAELREQRHAAEKGAADVEAMRELVHIPGFFPTPPKVIARLIEEAELRPGMSVLEPSAGKGDIAKAARATGAVVTCCEINPRLVSMLERDGFPVPCTDFLQMTAAGIYDRVLMNPPFENGQDREHVQKAYRHLHPETGTLVAIMSEGPFFRDTVADREFLRWLVQVDGCAERLPEDAFRCSERTTGVRTRIVIIDR